MKRILPKSLIGQIALVMAVALLVAQAINFSLVLTERQRLSRTRSEGPAITRFVLLAQRMNELSARERQILVPPPRGRTRIALGTQSQLTEAQAEPDITERLREIAASNNVPTAGARAATEPDVPGYADADGDKGRRWRGLRLSLQLQDGTWVNGRVLMSKPDPWLALRPALATLLTYLIILGAMIFIAARLGRPLRDLASAAERFKGGKEPPQVVPSGPADLRRAITAFNAMSERVSAMLDEKDRMLGAIGHDLRTPLASLRIRAESMEPEEERERMIATLEDMAATLDDTLALARSGRAVEPWRMVDVAALADTVVEEFRELGHAVEMKNGARRNACVQPDLLRRAVRNLIENAVNYAGSAEVGVSASGGNIVIEISDSGPGIPEDQIGRVTDSFYRLEPSRSRSTGGSGLGLTLARAAAQAHGGDLVLANRAEGGLNVRMIVPADGSKSGEKPAGQAAD